MDISILIPLYNVEAYIVHCLETVASQTYTGSMECIIVDDRGSDRSILLVEDFISHYKGAITFKIIRHTHNRGLAVARNTAVDVASGDFVSFLDADDWLEETALEDLMLMQEQTDADIVSGSALMHKMDGEEELTQPHYANPMEMVHRTIELTLDHVLWGRVIRRSLYIDHQIKAQEGVNYGEDHHTLPKLAYYSSKVATLDKVVYHYNRMNPNSYLSQKSSKVNISRYRQGFASIQILRQFFEDKDDYCSERLKAIQHVYCQYKMTQAALLGDPKAYREIAKDDSSNVPYLRYKAILLASRIKNKLLLMLHLR